MKIQNQGKRAFIVKPDQVLKGGEAHKKENTVYINPGETVEVTDELGEYLTSYSEILVLEPAKKGKKK